MFYVKWRADKCKASLQKKAWGLSGRSSLWLKYLNKRESLVRACYSVTGRRYNVCQHPHTAPATCLLCFVREVNTQALRHISVSGLRAVPTTRLKGQQPLCTAVRREVMLILILTESERVVVFHFVATYHYSSITSPGKKIKVILNQTFELT